MPSMEILANAKLNLTLDVIGKRPDGYHDLRMVMQSVTLGDQLTVEMGTKGGLNIRTDLNFLPNDERNLAAKAALRFREATGRDWNGLSISIQKNIPVCAGMAGGSSDAAAVLRALNQMTGAGLPPGSLARIGETVGSDVPYCVLGGTALAEGRGELLTALPPLPDCDIVICKPRFSISTPELFGKLKGVKLRCRPDTEGVLASLESGDLVGVARRMYNVFEPILSPSQGKTVSDIKRLLIRCGALGATMSGTGPTVFGIFDRTVNALEAQRVLSEQYRDVFLTRPV